MTKKVVARAAVLLVLLGSAGPSEAWGRGWHGGWGGWWWPGAVVGGLVLGAITAGAYAEHAPPAVSYEPAPVYAPPPAPAVQREVVYPNGRYILYGDGVTQPWRWVWVPAPPAGPPPPPPR